MRGRVGRLKAHLVKLRYNVAEWWRWWTLFSKDMPKVKQFVRNVSYHDGPRNKQKMLDIIVPDIEGPLPVMIYIHGGAWMLFGKDIYTRTCKTFANNGCIVFNINYRLGPKHTYPIPMLDVAEAVQWVCKHAAEYGGDPQNIFLAGDSAGAHLASLYASALVDKELPGLIGLGELIPLHCIKGLILFYGAFDFDTLVRTDANHIDVFVDSFLGSEPVIRERRVAHASPLRHVENGYPPSLIIAGEADVLYTESTAFAEKLEFKNILHKRLFFTQEEHPDAGHCFLNYHKRRCVQVALREITGFINEHKQN